MGNQQNTIKTSTKISLSWCFSWEITR